MKPQGFAHYVLRCLLTLAIIATCLPASAMSAPVPLSEPRAQVTTQAQMSETPEWINLYGLRVWVDGELAPVGSVIEAFTADLIPIARATITTAGQYGLLTVY